ncbi:MAG: YwmB family TATA-box binding protein [Bacillota bacterium]
MQRFGMKFIAGMVLLCGITGILAGFTMDSTNKRGSELLVESSGSQLELLYALGKAQIDSPLHVTVKLQGESQTLSVKKSEQAASILAEEMGISDLSVELEHGEKAYRARDSISDTDVRLDWVQAGETSYVKIQLDAQGPDGIQHLIRIQEKAQASMMKAGITPAWNASIQGSVYNGMTAGETVQRLEEEMAVQLPLNAVDSYQDIATESRSYEVPSLKTYVMGGENPIHMQIAVHEDSMKENNRITIGFPIITIEY